MADDDDELPDITCPDCGEFMVSAGGDLVCPSCGLSMGSA